MTLLILAGSLAVITLGAEALVRGASMLALRRGVSPLFVGLTIVGFGTSTPELGASLAASLRGASDVAVGNVVGSNVFNIAVILGLTALIRPVRVRLRAVRRDLLVAIAAAAVPWSSLLAGNTINRGIGGLLLVGLVIYVATAYRSAQRAPFEEKKLAEEEVRSTLVAPSARQRLAGLGWNVLLVLGGLGLLVVGSRAFVDAAIILARSVGMSDLVIGLTIVAAGTSLPELVTSLVAARRRNPDIALGNVIGSNIFNCFGILGTCAIVRPQSVGVEVLVRDTPVMLVATLALIPIMRSGGTISRREGGLLLVGYGVYLGALLKGVG